MLFYESQKKLPTQNLATHDSAAHTPPILQHTLMHVVHIISHVLEILKIYPLQKLQCMWYLAIHQNLTLLHFEATSKNCTIHKFPATQYHLHVLQLCLTLRTKMERIKI